MLKVHRSGDHAGAGWNGHSDEVFLPWTPGVRRLRIAANIKPGKPAGTRNQEQEAGNRAQARKQCRHVCTGNVSRNLMKAPSPGKQGWRNAEGDDIGERIEFTSEIAGGAGHARDAAIKSVK